MKKTFYFLAVSICAIGMAATLPAAAETVKAADAAISEKQIDTAYHQWCDGLMAIADAHKKGADYRAAAEKMLADNYLFQDGKILFKPTLAHGDQTFRLDHEGALSYFVGGNPKYAQDIGFALRGWTACRYKIAGIIVENDIALSMANVWVTDSKGSDVKVDKTLVFKKDADNKLRLIAHMSALPYTPPAE